MNERIEILRILNSSKGDDLYRAKAAFKGRTHAQMQQEYGQSGETCQQILDSYQAREDKIDALIRWVNSR